MGRKDGRKVETELIDLTHKAAGYRRPFNGRIQRRFLVVHVILDQSSPAGKTDVNRNN